MVGALAQRSMSGGRVGDWITGVGGELAQASKSNDDSRAANTVLSSRGTFHLSNDRIDLLDRGGAFCALRRYCGDNPVGLGLLSLGDACGIFQHGGLQGDLAVGELPGLGPVAQEPAHEERGAGRCDALPEVHSFAGSDASVLTTSKANAVNTRAWVTIHSWRVMAKLVSSVRP